VSSPLLKTSSLLDIAKLLEQHGIGCIVIEGDNGKVAGIVSERDLPRARGGSGASSSRSIGSASRAVTTGLVMKSETGSFKTLGPDWPIAAS
jgi:CBS domain-containing protein